MGSCDNEVSRQFVVDHHFPSFSHIFPIARNREVNRAFFSPNPGMERSRHSGLDAVLNCGGPAGSGGPETIASKMAKLGIFWDFVC